jgi:hypothetical protein
MGVSLAIFQNSVFAGTSDRPYWESRRRARLAAVPTAASSIPTDPIVPASRHQPLYSALSRSAVLFQRETLPSGTPRGVVLMVHDVHRNADAQGAIGGLLRELFARGALDLLVLEGVFGPLDVSRYRACDAEEARRCAADYLLKTNDISGAVHAVLTSPAPPPPVVGVDDPAAYRANVAAYLSSRPHQSSVNRWLAERASVLRERKERFYSREFLAFDAQVEAYRGGRLSLADYARVLADGGVGSPRVHAFLDLNDRERALDRAAVERERAVLVKTLAARGSPADVESWVRLAAAARAGNGETLALHEALLASARSAGCPASMTSRLAEDVDVRRRAAALDVDALRVDLEQARRDKEDRLAVGAAARSVLDEDRALALTRGLARFELGPEDWRDYRRLARATRPAGFRAWERFYEAAHRRDEAMGDRLLREASSRGSRAVALIVGGFHAASLRERLRSAGWAVVEVSPRFARAGEDVYLSAFLRERTPVERLFAGERLYVTPDPANLAHLPVAMALAGPVGDENRILDALPGEDHLSEIQTVAEGRAGLYRVRGKPAVFTRLTRDGTGAIRRLVFRIAHAPVLVRGGGRSWLSVWNRDVAGQPLWLWVASLAVWVVFPREGALGFAVLASVHDGTGYALPGVNLGDVDGGLRFPKRARETSRPRLPSRTEIRRTADGAPSPVLRTDIPDDVQADLWDWMSHRPGAGDAARRFFSEHDVYADIPVSIDSNMHTVEWEHRVYRLQGLGFNAAYGFPTAVLYCLSALNAAPATSIGARARELVELLVKPENRRAAPAGAAPTSDAWLFRNEAPVSTVLPAGLLPEATVSTFSTDDELDDGATADEEPSVPPVSRKAPTLRGERVPAHRPSKPKNLPPLEALTPRTAVDVIRRAWSGDPLEKRELIQLGNYLKLTARSETPLCLRDRRGLLRVEKMKIIGPAVILQGIRSPSGRSREAETGNIRGDKNFRFLAFHPDAPGERVFAEIVDAEGDDGVAPAQEGATVEDAPSPATGALRILWRRAWSFLSTEFAGQPTWAWGLAAVCVWVSPPGAFAVLGVGSLKVVGDDEEPARVRGDVPDAVQRDLWRWIHGDASAGATARDHFGRTPVRVLLSKTQSVTDFHHTTTVRHESLILGVGRAGPLPSVALWRTDMEKSSFNPASTRYGLVARQIIEALVRPENRVAVEGTATSAPVETAIDEVKPEASIAKVSGGGRNESAALSPTEASRWLNERIARARGLNPDEAVRLNHFLDAHRVTATQAVFQTKTRYRVVGVNTGNSQVLQVRRLGEDGEGPETTLRVMGNKLNVLQFDVPGAEESPSTERVAARSIAAPTTTRPTLPPASVDAEWLFQFEAPPTGFLPLATPDERSDVAPSVPTPKDHLEDSVVRPEHSPRSNSLQEAASAIEFLQRLLNGARLSSEQERLLDRVLRERARGRSPLCVREGEILIPVSRLRVENGVWLQWWGVPLDAPKGAPEGKRIVPLSSGRVRTLDVSPDSSAPMVFADVLPEAPATALHVGQPGYTRWGIHPADYIAASDKTSAPRKVSSLAGAAALEKLVPLLREVVAARRSFRTLETKFVNQMLQVAAESGTPVVIRQGASSLRPRRLSLKRSGVLELEGVRRYDSGFTNLVKLKLENAADRIDVFDTARPAKGEWIIAAIREDAEGDAPVASLAYVAAPFLPSAWLRPFGRKAEEARRRVGLWGLVLEVPVLGAASLVLGGPALWSLLAVVAGVHVLFAGKSPSGAWDARFMVPLALYGLVPLVAPTGPLVWLVGTGHVLWDAAFLSPVSARSWFRSLDVGRWFTPFRVRTRDLTPHALALRLRGVVASSLEEVRVPGDGRGGWFVAVVPPATSNGYAARVRRLTGDRAILWVSDGASSSGIVPLGAERAVVSEGLWTTGDLPRLSLASLEVTVAGSVPGAPIQALVLPDDASVDTADSDWSVGPFRHALIIFLNQILGAVQIRLVDLDRLDRLARLIATAA